MERSTSLKGKLLLAMPGIGDPRFQKAVIFICTHDENGALGLVLNQPMGDLKLQDLLDEIGTKFSDDISGDLPVRLGGPMDTTRGFILHTPEYQSLATSPIDENFSLSNTLDALNDFAEGHGPEKMVFVIGYAGWVDGQLEKELIDNAWLLTESTQELVFNTPPEEQWTRALAMAKIDPGRLSADMGHA